MSIEFSFISISSLVSLILAAFAALLKTQTVVDWLDEKLLEGKPKKLTQETIDLVNEYFKNDEVTIKAILKRQPKLTFQPYTRCTEIIQEINTKVEERLAFEANQQTNKLPNDPHAFVYPRSAISFSSDGTNSSLSLYASRCYSELATLSGDYKAKLLILGANNILLDPYNNQLIAHVRSNKSNSQVGKVHGFGGGYMSYWEGGSKTESVRRDDQKNLRITAMRELNEEAGILSLNHIPNLIYVSEETHIINESGKLGHLTFFYVTRIDKDQLLAEVNSGDPREGHKYPIDLTWSNVRSMILRGTIGDLEVHPQFRSVLAIWILQGAMGVPFLTRLRLSNYFTRRKLRILLAS